MRRREGERGAALLTVLLLVAVIAVIAGTALERMRLATRLAGNAAAGEQAHAYATAAETLALVRVGDLLAQQPDRMTLAQGWSGRPFALPVPGGSAVARVVDGGNCFNLNSLVTETGPGTYAALTPARLQFVRLMKLLGIGADTADQVSGAASDWIDTDSTPVEGGAEDDRYQGLGYRTANTLMADPSELRAVAGVTPQLYATLRPWVCTLPEARPSAVNVDTLTPEQAPLAAMLFPDTLGVSAARDLLLRRPPDGYASTGAFETAASLAGGGTGPDGVVSVTSRWFALAVDVTVGTTDLHERALIDATRLPPRLVSRQWGEPS